jgi:gliding motility-associated-like protein
MFNKLISLVVFFILHQISSAQLILNEISQGNSGNREYVEFVVTGTPTCANPCFDLRGWIIDDNNGFHASGSGTGISAGCLRFRNIPQWACVPYGSIILIYNENEKNTSIALADDPTDANNDKVYVIPGNSNVLEGNPSSPSVVNGPSYSGLTFTTPGSWNTVILGNGDDAFHTVSPTNLTAAAFALGWGNNTNNVDIYFSGSAAGKVFYNANTINNNPSLQANWVSANVGAAETPGLPNNAANSNWIQGLRNQTPVNVPVYSSRSICILAGTSITIAGQPVTAAGVYYDTLLAFNGCDSIVTTNLSVSTPVVMPMQAPPACDSLVFQGFVFRRDTIIRDTLKTTLGCDSVYRSVSIQIKKSKRDTVVACINPGGSYFAGGAPQNSPGFYSDVFTGSNGCDSVRVTHLKLVLPTTIQQTITACNSYVLNGVTYTSSTTVRDTVKNAQGCDSIYRVYNVQISALLRDTIRVCIHPGQSYFAGGAPRTVSGFYSDTFPAGICDSIRVVDLKVLSPTTQQQTLSGCGSVVFKGVTYTNSAIVIDTIKSALGCDSIYRQISIQVNSSVFRTRNVCIHQGQTFFAGGANQNTSGTYNDTYTSANGCDSIVTTILDVITISNTSSTLQGCDSVVYKGVTYRQNTTVFDTLKNSQGCITQITAISIVIRTRSQQTVQVCINRGGSYFAGGAPQTTTGVYQDVFQNSAGCDSIIITELTVVDFDIVNTTFNACDSFTLNGITYYQNTQLSDTLRNNAGCVTNITRFSINISYSNYETIDACINPGGSYFAGGSLQTQAGIYFDTILQPNSCFTFRATRLALVTPQTDTLPWITATEQYEWNGETIVNDTIVQQVIYSQGKCDSVIRFQPIKINKVLPYNLFMPNAFSPNDDGVNDILKPLFTENIEILDFKIFNRWGELVYKGKEGWDGYYRGVKQKTDTFIYTLKAQEKVSKKVMFLKGSFLLLQ